MRNFTKLNRSEISTNFMPPNGRGGGNRGKGKGREKKVQ